MPHGTETKFKVLHSFLPEAFDGTTQAVHIRIAPSRLAMSVLVKQLTDVSATHCVVHTDRNGFDDMGELRVIGGVQCFRKTLFTERFDVCLAVAR